MPYLNKTQKLTALQKLRDHKAKLYEAEATAVMRPRPVIPRPKPRPRLIFCDKRPRPKRGLNIPASPRAEQSTTPRQQHAQVPSWTVLSSACRLALARCGRSMRNRNVQLALLILLNYM